MNNNVRVVTTAATTSGSTTTGAIAIGFKSGSGSSTVAGVPLSGTDAINFTPLVVGRYPAIAYTVTSGTLYVVEVLP